jgi:glycosyltransferase involved in cell wall biosynthesis
MAARALALEKVVKDLEISHLHAHWPYATRVCWLCHSRTTVPISASIHAHEVLHDSFHFDAVFPDLKFAAFCNRAALTLLMKNKPREWLEKSHLVYHGVSLASFPTTPIPPSPPLRVITAGRLTPTKGFHRLIRACALAKQQGTTVELTIVGAGPQRPELLALAESIGFGQCLRLPGWVSHADVAMMLAQAHVFALMADTNYHDGLPNVVLEAMATARPVILSPFPASTEAVQDGVEGWILASPDDEAGCATRLSMLSSSPRLMEIVGKNARQRAVDDYDEDKHLPQLTSLFEAAVAPQRTLAH